MSLASLLAQPAVLAMGSGVLAGAIAGTTLVVTGTLPDRPDPQLVLLECPDAGRQVARVDAGLAMLATGRNGDGTWVELYIGVPGVQTGWAAATNLKLDTTIETLPVVPCVVTAPGTLNPPPSTAPTPSPTVEPTVIATVVATPVPSVSLPPGASPTPTPRVTPTPRPTRTPPATATPLPPTIPAPTPSPTPGATADLFPPTVSAPFITSPAPGQAGNYYIGHLPCSPPSATIRVTATDPNGVSFVRLWYRPPGGTTTFATMSYIGGNTWQYVITPDNTWLDGEIGLWSQAQDTLGNLSGQFAFGNPNSTSDVSLFWSAFCIT